MFTRLIGLVSFLYCGFLATATWIHIATKPHNGWNYLAAVVCTLLASVGLLLFFGKSEKKSNV